MRVRGSWTGPSDTLDTLVPSENKIKAGPRRYSYRMFISMTATEEKLAETVNAALWVGSGIWYQNELVIECISGCVKDMANRKPAVGQKEALCKLELTQLSGLRIMITAKGSDGKPFICSISTADLLEMSGFVQSSCPRRELEMQSLTSASSFKSLTP
ncbi:uncharacterized protein CTRU02_206986 [Colletotrichum truncatum]|uniref:Uncharacterized protein n=1 Tax=Colletotrichum truncatum TaxID=5467 RepID=A0ACC3YZ61_COLTU